MAALLFDAARRRRALEGRMVDHLEDAGFSEVILPVLDYLDPYEAFLSDTSRAELHRFVDRDGRLLALRADFTPMLARVLAPRLPALDLPLKLFYRGDVVRYQEERAGRQREFYQVGAELLGPPTEVSGLGEDADRADEEMLRRFLALLRESPKRPLRVVLGFAGALDRLLLDSVDHLSPFDLAQALTCRRRSLPGPHAATLRRLVETGLPGDPDDLGVAAGARLRRILALKDRLQGETPEVSLAVDLAEFSHQHLDPALTDAGGARAYYDGLLFRGYAGRRGLPVGAGGRYDQLFRGLGADVSAVGFSLDLERLMNGLGEDDG
jgi:ATP phosphoribosyltransferase regulatory subunit